MARAWPHQVVDRLTYLRETEGAYHHETGAPNFDRHWSLTVRAYPPRAADDGGWAPQLNFQGEETVTGFFKRKCEDAYYGVVGPKGSGNGPALRHFRPEMVQDIDDASPALRSTSSHGRYRMAA